MLVAFVGEGDRFFTPAADGVPLLLNAARRPGPETHIVVRNITRPLKWPVRGECT